MHLVVVSHKICWPAESSASGFATDGGFPIQMGAIAELFERTTIVIPCRRDPAPDGLSPLEGNGLDVVPLSVPRGTGLKRKFHIFVWLLKNGLLIWREIRKADAVHAPIPGDVGTIGMISALVQRKPLLVRHCGNWLVQRTIAERVWKWSMEYFAGGRNVMFATGGGSEPPSSRNPNVKWIFSTSLRENQLVQESPRQLPADGELNLAIACRQEPGKGTEKVIDSLSAIRSVFPETRLAVIGSGSLVEGLRRRVDQLGLSEHVTFYGRIPQYRVVELLNNAHVFCYPTTASEGFPKVVLEALAVGLPVITTRVSVLPKLLGSGAGILLAKADAEELAAAVVRLCSDPDAYSRMSALAIETAREFSLEKWRDVIGDSLRKAWNVNSLSSKKVERASVLEHS
jgi:glycosyltransferase involved in cell wall biosynthesis